MLITFPGFNHSSPFFQTCVQYFPNYMCQLSTGGTCICIILKPDAAFFTSVTRTVLMTLGGMTAAE